MFRRKTVLLVFAALSVMVAAYAAAQIAPIDKPLISNEATAKEVIQALNVMDDARLRYSCIIGSLGGALISIAMFKTPHFRPMLAKFLVSSISGIMATPAIMRLSRATLDTDYIMGGALVVAIVSYSVIQVLSPLVPQAVAWAFRQKYLPPEDDK